MNYSINKNSGKSAYLQLYEQLRRDIVNGTYKFGDKLPSKRILSEETDTSVVTAEHAFEILSDEGYIESRQRYGYFVTYQNGGFIPVAEKETVFEKSSPLCHNDEDFPFSILAKIMRKTISEHAETLTVKSSNSGLPEFRRAICDYLARAKGMKVLPKQVIIGSGAEYLYGLTVQFLGRDRIYGVETPSYDKILSVYRANGVECELLKLGGNGILSSELEKTRATVLHTTPFGSYPSGVTADISKRREYIEWAKKRSGVIIEDDYNSEFTVSSKNDDTVFSLEPENSVIYINTFTKTVAASMRVGYMVLPINFVDDFERICGFYSCTVPTFEQYVLAQLIDSGDFERHINRIRRRRRQALKDQNF